MARPILIVDDDADEARSLAETLQTAGYTVAAATDGIDGLLAVERSDPVLVVLAWNLPFVDGAIFTQAVYAGLAQPPPIIALFDAPLPHHPGPGANVAAVLPRRPAANQLLSALPGVLGPLAQTARSTPS